MKKIAFLILAIAMIACGGSKEEAESKKALEANMSEIDSIENLEKIDAMGEELGDLKIEIEGRKAELDSLLKEAEKDSE